MYCTFTLFLYLVSPWTTVTNRTLGYTAKVANNVLPLFHDLPYPSCKQHPLLPSVHTQTHSPSLQHVAFGLSVCPTITVTPVPLSPLSFIDLWSTFQHHVNHSKAPETIKPDPG